MMAPMSSNSPKKTPSKSKAKAPRAPKAPSQSKRIKQAYKALSKALEQHAEITAGGGVPLKKAMRASAKLAAAAAEYADAVKAKTGLESPFVAGNSELDGDTITSLKAERAAIEKAVTGSIPVVETPAPAPAPVAAAPKEPARRATTPRAAAAAPRVTTPRATPAARRTTSSIDKPTTRRAAAPKKPETPAP